MKEEIQERYKEEIKEYSKEQVKLARTLEIKDKIKIKDIEKIGAIENIFIQNKIISAIIVCNKDFEIIEQEYFSDFVKFPYIPGFRAYREVPAMLKALDKLEENPDIILINGHGTLHPRGLGIASHFSLASGIPTIGVASDSVIGEIKDKDIFINNKLSGKIINTKEGANPLYISPGNQISVENSSEFIKTLIKFPHKIPEPLRLARKYAKEVKEELI